MMKIGTVSGELALSGCVYRKITLTICITITVMLAIIITIVIIITIIINIVWATYKVAADVMM